MLAIALQGWTLKEVVGIKVELAKITARVDAHLRSEKTADSTATPACNDKT